MSSLSCLSSSSSSSGSSATEPLSVGAIQILPPMEVIRVDDPECPINRSDPSEQSSHLLGLDWVDPKVTGFTFVYLDEASISSFIGKYPILKSNANDGILAVDYYRSTDTICMGWSPSKGFFFFVYYYLFFYLHVAFPFDDFTMGVFQTLNVAPSQLHPNTWVSLRTFRLICDVFCLSPTPSTFLSYYTSHLIELVSPFTTSHKNFKGKFFKFFVEPEGMRFIFDEVGWSRFSLYWTRNPTQFKEWPRPALSVEEQEIYSLFDKFLRRLPTRKLLVMYKSSQQWATFQGMFALIFVFVGILVFC